MILPTLQNFLLFASLAAPSLSYEENTLGRNLRVSADEAQDRKLQSDPKCGRNRDSLEGCLRFSKLMKGRTSTSKGPKYPLGSNQYPFNDTVEAEVKKNDAVSVVSTKPGPSGWSRSDLVSWAGGKPSFPTCSGQNFQFWNELREVVEVQKMRLAGGNACEVMPLPILWKDFSMEEAAEAVRNEFPGLNQANFLTEVLKKRYGEFDYDNDVLQGYSANRFVLGDVMMADMNTWAVGVVSDYNFYLKWQFGRPRPEEALYRVLRASVENDDVNCDTNDLPSDVTNLASFKVAVFSDPTETFRDAINEATKFTAYENEGSPQHPSWPAMHSAASSAALWLATVIDLDSPGAEGIIEEAMLTDYAVAYARTIAGVHYPGDNIAGLKLGQEILSRLLPDQLSADGSRYNGDKDKVKAKIDRIQASGWVNWDKFFIRHGIINNVGIESKNGYQDIATNYENRCSTKKFNMSI